MLGGESIAKSHKRFQTRQFLNSIFFASLDLDQLAITSALLAI